MDKGPVAAIATLQEKSAIRQLVDKIVSNIKKVINTIRGKKPEERKIVSDLEEKPAVAAKPRSIPPKPAGPPPEPPVAQEEKPAFSPAPGGPTSPITSISAGVPVAEKAPSIAELANVSPVPEPPVPVPGTPAFVPEGAPGKITSISGETPPAEPVAP